MFRLDVPLQSLGLQENHAVTIAVNTMMAGVCRDFRQSPWFCVTAVIIGGVCTVAVRRVANCYTPFTFYFYKISSVQLV